MAVYTKLSKIQLEKFFSKYNLGKLINFNEIKDGIENTNYSIELDKGKFILTLYEKRVEEKDLPFFISLMKNLFDKKFPSPEPIINRNGNYISEILNKKAAVVSFLEGKAKKNIEPKDCYEIGMYTAKLHSITKNLTGKRENKLSVNSWRKIYNKIKVDCSKIHSNLPVIIENNLDKIEKNWPKNIPAGIIHADLFPDNVFFINDRLSGIIDFYFACNDYYAYELAICINAWCFERNNEFNVSKAKHFLQQYNSIRNINKVELESLPILARAASLRFLLTRLYDEIHNVKSDLVITKDPNEYFEKLKFHQSVKSVDEYGI